MVKNDAIIKLFYVFFTGRLHCKVTELETEFFEKILDPDPHKMNANPQPWDALFPARLFKKKIGNPCSMKGTHKLVIWLFPADICLHYTVHGMKESFLYVPIFYFMFCFFELSANIWSLFVD